jgi:hypothetical protein
MNASSKDAPAARTSDLTRGESRRIAAERRTDLDSPLGKVLWFLEYGPGRRALEGRRKTAVGMGVEWAGASVVKTHDVTALLIDWRGDDLGAVEKS